ncbi:uncharacterized protein LOC142978539 [Anticarsia gemmatalis]|uniref:uncharacterized protein LOC142978539 n=1 Tax=Anticarsia gemmatalis TaxID=129554 RepID=UPI003F7655D7
MEVDIDYQFKTHNFDEDNSYCKITQCVKSIIKNEGYINYSVDKKVYRPDGGNFLGVLCEVDIKGTTAGRKKETNLFLKIIVGPSEDMTIISLSDVFRTELFFYNELSRIYMELQNDANVPFKERFKTVKIYNESTPEVIVLENMLKKGYRTNYRKDCMSLDDAEVTVKALAKFHALSFVLEAKRPMYFERKIKCLKTGVACNEDWRDFLMKRCEITLNYLKSESRRRFEAFIPKIYERFIELLTSKCSKKVLCHGDFRPNNILMKKVNGVTTDLIPIDYQLIYYACPIFDLAYLIFPATDRPFREKHLNYLKELYYNTLKSFLLYFKMDITNVYPKKDFEKDFRDKLDHGLTLSLLLIPLLMANEHDPPNLTEGEWAKMSFEEDDRCKERLVGVVEDFIEMGYL